MYPQDFDKEESINRLLNRLEAMSRNGTVAFFEKSAFHQMIDYFEDQQDFVKALELATMATEQHSFSAGFYIRKARLHLENGQNSEALANLDKAHLYDSSDINITLVRADILLASNKYEEAIGLLYSSIENSESLERSQIYLALSHAFESNQEYSNMFRVLKKALNANPKNEEALERIWICVEWCKKYEESAIFHKKFIDRFPYSAQAWYNLGQAYYCMNEMYSAIEAFEYAYIIKPDFEYAYKDCIATCVEVGNYDKALQCCEEALDNLKADSDIYVNIGICHENLEDINLAKHYYLMAIRKNPNNETAHFRMGECYMEEENWVSAIQSFKRAIELNARKEEYVASIAEAYLRTDDYDTAIIYFRKAVDLAPDQSIYWIQYATFLIDIEAYELALDILEEAADNMSSAELYYCEAACLFNMGVRKDALLKLSLALEKDYDLHTALFELFPSLQEDEEILDLIAFYHK